MKQVRFIAHGSNSAVGGFAPRDTARVDDALAAHLVDEAKVAVYADAQVAARPEAKASEGLTVEQIKSELESRKITVPAGVTLKADLAKLLDEAPAP